MFAAVACVAVVTVAVWLSKPASRPVQGLYDYLGLNDPATSGTRAKLEDQATEELVASCMASRGFTYRPRRDGPPQPPDPELAPVEWAEKWGFGIATSVGTSTDESLEADPNDSYIQSLSGTQRNAFFTALRGAAEPAASSAPEGCLPLANDQVYGRYNSVLTPVSDALESIGPDIHQDSRVAPAIADWASCHVGAGLPRDHPERVAQRLASDVSTQLMAIMGPPPGRPDYDRAALSSLQASDKRVATAVAICSQRFQDAYRPIANEYESRWASLHADTLKQVTEQLAEFDADMSRIASGG